MYRFPAIHVRTSSFATVSAMAKPGCLYFFKHTRQRPTRTDRRFALVHYSSAHFLVVDVFVAREESPGGSAVERSSAATCGETQPRYRRHPSSSDCQLYVACVTGPDGRYVPVLMRCLLGLQWDDNVKMCVTSSGTCRDDHVTNDHVTRDHAPADHVANNEHRRHQFRHFHHNNDVIY